MPPQDISKTLRFNVRKGPIIKLAIVIAVAGAGALWLAFHLAAHPEIRLDGRGAALNLLPNPVRVGIFAVFGTWMIVAALALALRAMTFLGVLLIRPEGLSFESGAGTWTAPWRSIRSVKILRKAVVIERDQDTTPSRWFIVMWQQMRYGCDPNANRLSFPGMSAADGGLISSEDLARTIADYRRDAAPSTADRPRAA